MPEDFDDQGSERPDIGRFVGIVRRRHLQFLIPLFLGWLLVWGASWVLPPRYKSTTSILVEQPSMPQNYVTPNISDDMQTRLDSIKQQILSRTRLLPIIDGLTLYSGNGKKFTADEKVVRMRNDIDIDVVRDPQKNDISEFTISYTAKDPHLAQKVTGELTASFINENSKARLQDSKSTTSFIEQQLADARANLAEQAAKVKDYQNTHEGALPEQEQSNLQILNGLQAQLQNEQDALNTAKQTRIYLQSMIEQERNAESRTRATNPDGTAAPVEDVATLDHELETMRARLAELSSHYTDRYPDVVSLKAQIAKTETRRDNLIAAQKQKPVDVKPLGDPADDPTLSAAARQFQGQLKANQLEITNREQTVTNLEGKIGAYEGRLNAEPGTQQELADLTRGYNQSQANYDDLLKKKDESSMATNMEILQQGERFTPLDPPNLPTKPDFPNRLKFCAIGLAIGMAMGCLIAGGFEFMDDRLHGEKDIKALLPVAVLSEVPEIVNPADRLELKKKLTMGWAATAIVFTTILAGCLFTYLHK